MGNAVSNAVGNAVTNATRNAAPDPTRPDPTQMLLVVAVGRHGKTATREPYAPQWFRPFGPPVVSLLGSACECRTCDVRWYGNPNRCWSCDQPGRLRFGGF